MKIVATEDHEQVCLYFKIPVDVGNALNAFVNVIKIKEPETYDHSVRVAKFMIAITNEMHLDTKVGLFTGLLHDWGKVQCDPKVLHKIEKFTGSDLKHVSQHVMDGYRALRGMFDFTADVIVWSHEFQTNSYPAKIPPFLHDYSAGTKVLIPMYGRVLALADSYDAIHRRNDRYPDMAGAAIRKIMEDHNRDLATLVADLYEAHIFDDTLGTGYDPD